MVSEYSTFINFLKEEFKTDSEAFEIRIPADDVYMDDFYSGMVNEKKRRALKKHGIQKLSDFCNITEEYLVETVGIHPENVEYIMNALRERGLRLAG